ncbi:methylene-tetrahydromethanopterin dehydrogenase N-terminal domain-containing protein [Fulvimarina sp. 2208YS6-2-32]|uniref:Methylene-tetrahydromethanopterin dehydrogenase N-terminal domain-containing protein n=1 Tax=Fulvimarina uroteuthidis TaxID=3098149 RepID=A0ABU5HZY7_9HYPH|nr:methylene-tetrahydromethanopterin dehydrogenase N-terminal domain-containing protein [Fulvimarina sp. 2208YS6-2-32]MDY8108098.1 methylene-tetrahydromethanopterin dehydrogenase N-terminal domain-containing protein [Fulvimarina sp. 2208YS6-2-32]
MPKNILHMLTPHKHVSPFDVNQALDAGYDSVTPYEMVDISEVSDLVQDVIFSRPPDHGQASAIFFGGDDAVLALDMIEKAKAALVPPFTCNIMADPAGSFTTAAAMVAKVEKALKDKKGVALKDTTIAVFGATGVVGYCAAVIAASEGAKVRIVGYSGVERVQKRADEMKERFGVDVEAVDGSSDDKNTAIVSDVEVILSAAKAGVQVLAHDQMKKASRLLVAADVNAVPPVGLEGIDVMDDVVAIDGTDAFGIGALAIGMFKSKTEYGLLRQMIESEEGQVLDFRHAFTLARKLVNEG